MSRRVGVGRSGFDWRIGAIAAFVAVGLLVVVVLVVLGAGPNPYAGAIQADGGGGHIPACQPVDYTSNPPTSGCHDPSPTNWGVYATPAPTQQLIHTLEHGGIVIWYEPDKLTDAQVAELSSYVNSQITGNRFKVILSPWDGADFGHPIAVTAWRWLLYQDEVNLDAIRGFTDEHYQRSPEPNGGPGPPAV
jgi:hypothetical protein